MFLKSTVIRRTFCQPRSLPVSWPSTLHWRCPPADFIFSVAFWTVGHPSSNPTSLLLSIEDTDNSVRIRFRRPIWLSDHCRLEREDGVSLAWSISPIASCTRSCNSRSTFAAWLVYVPLRDVLDDGTIAGLESVSLDAMALVCLLFLRLLHTR